MATASLMVVPLSSASAGTVHSGLMLAERRLQMLAVAQVDLHGRHGDALLGQEDAHPARARRGRAVVELHGGSLRQDVRADMRYRRRAGMDQASATPMAAKAAIVRKPARKARAISD